MVQGLRQFVIEQEQQHVDQEIVVRPCTLRFAAALALLANKYTHSDGTNTRAPTP